jgi:hypothetical protein
MLHVEGFTYRDLQQHAQAHAAKRMLESTQLAVGEVGRRLGYRDTANFSAAFRSWTGLTPTEWRVAVAASEPGRQGVATPRDPFGSVCNRGDMVVNPYNNDAKSTSVRRRVSPVSWSDDR